jgi:hypothetical protein
MSRITRPVLRWKLYRRAALPPRSAATDSRPGVRLEMPDAASRIGTILRITKRGNGRQERYAGGD